MYVVKNSQCVWTHLILITLSGAVHILHKGKAESEETGYIRHLIFQRVSEIEPGTESELPVSSCSSFL